MTAPERPLTDTQIEAAILRRIGGHADASLARSIAAAAAATPQTHAPSPMGAGRLRAVVMLAAAAIAITALAVAAAGSRPSIPPPVATQPTFVTHPTASLAADGSPSATLSDHCETDTVSVYTGSAMPSANAAPVEVPSGLIAQGVYLTQLDGESQFDAWAVSTGESTRIASFVAPGVNVMKVDDVSADGRQALIQVGVIHGALPGPSCDDLYLVQTDGTGATRLTDNGAEEHALDGRFSPDGRYVAFRASVDAAEPTITVTDLLGDRTPRSAPCTTGAYGHALRWAPTGNRLAVACSDNRVLVVTIDLTQPTGIGVVTEAPSLVVAPSSLRLDAQLIDTAWIDATHLLAVHVLSGVRSNGPFQLRTLALDNLDDPAGWSWSEPVAVDPWLADAGFGTGISLAPDGHAFAAYADPLAEDPGGDQLGLYVVDAATGHAKRAIPWAFADPGWTIDSRAIVYVGSVGTEYQPVLKVRESKGTDGTATALLPAAYRTGIWRGAAVTEP
jgi:hypothetical protein